MDDLLKDGYALCLNTWLFNDDLKDDIRLLLYVSSLCATNGYCYAKNEHFMEKFKIKHSPTVSQKIKRLEKLGYIKIEYEKRGFEIVSRKIFLSVSPLTGKLIDHELESYSTINLKANRPLTGKLNNNNTINNNTINNILITPQAEEKEEIDINIINKKESNEIDNIDDLKQAMNKLQLQEEFFYKIGDDDSYLRTLTEFFYYYEEKGKPLTIKTAQTKFKWWLKPKKETEEDREELKKGYLRMINRKKSKNNTTPVVENSEENNKKEIEEMELFKKAESELSEREKIEEMERAEKELLDLTKGRGNMMPSFKIMVQGRYKKNLISKLQTA